MTQLPVENPLFKLLERRLDPAHLRQRLTTELEREKRIFSQAVGFFHIDNWYSIHSVIRNTLRLSLLHAKARRNALQLDITENTISLPHLPTAFENFKILHISDLHLDINEEMPLVLRDKIEKLEYDVCVITGDFRAKTFGAYDAALVAMQKVANVMRAPAYAVLGNHDSVQMLPGLEAMGIQVLMNESVIIERGGSLLHMAGIDDPHYYRSHDISKAAKDVPEDAVSVLLSHSPEPYKKAAEAGFDCFLCGHTHGGQICLPGGVPLMKNARAPRAMCNGQWTYQGMQGFTSRGSGSSVVDVRLNCPPELVMHTLRKN